MNRNIQYKSSVGPMNTKHIRPLTNALKMNDHAMLYIYIHATHLDNKNKSIIRDRKVTLGCFLVFSIIHWNLIYLWIDSIYDNKAENKDNFSI